jgi:hypothetical protein
MSQSALFAIPTRVPPAPVPTSVKVDVDGELVIVQLQDQTGVKVTFYEASAAEELAVMLHQASIKARLGLVVPKGPISRG